MPQNYLIESKEVVNVTMGLIATMAALVLALLVSAAQGSFGTQRNEVGQGAASFALLDRILAEYGPKTSVPRAELRTIAVSTIDQLWSGNSVAAQRATRAGISDFLDQIRHLQPSDDFQRALIGQAMEITAKLGETMALLMAQSRGSISAVRTENLILRDGWPRVCYWNARWSHF